MAFCKAHLRKPATLKWIHRMKCWKCLRRRMHKRTQAESSISLLSRQRCRSFFRKDAKKIKRWIHWLWQAETKFLYSVHNPVHTFRCSCTICFTWLTVQPVGWPPWAPGPRGSPRLRRNHWLTQSLIWLCIIWEPSRQEAKCQHRFAKPFHLVIEEIILSKSPCWLLN